MAINGNFQFRRSTAAEWSSANPVLLSGELGLETDTAKFKIGNGTSAWNALPYGGIKGDTGVASQTIVGATTVINPNQNPSVTDADGGPNADLRFSLPRAREVVAQTTNTVTPGTAASVTQAADAEGDVLLTFNIPRGAKGWTPVLVVVSDGERRVLRLIDYIDGEGTKPSIPTDNYVGTTGLTALANAVDIRGATGATGPAANAFTNIAVAGQTTVSAEVANDTLTITNGTGIAVTTDAANDSITITNNDRGSQQNIFKNIAVSGQSTIVADTNDDTLTIVGSGSVTVTTDAATDTVTISGAVAAPQNCFAVVTGNTGTASADLPADTLAITGGTGISTTATDTPDGIVINNTGVTSFNGATGAITGVNSVNGQTGTVTVNAARPRIGPPVLANATTTTETVVARFAIPANFLVAGDAIRVVVNHQSAGTGTLIYRARIGATGTITDGLLAQLTTSAAQVANAQGRCDFTIYFPNNTTATGSGFAIQQAAVLGTVTGAGANVTISNAATVNLSITVTCSAAAANVTRGAHAVVGD